VVTAGPARRRRLPVALRRSLRVGSRSRQPVEDLGVVPDETHEPPAEVRLAGFDGDELIAGRDLQVRG
jgi:hypothetical protein